VSNRQASLHRRIPTASLDDSPRNLVSRRAMIGGAYALLLFRWSSARADVVDDGKCNHVALFWQHPPWRVIFDSTEHPLADNGLPTIRPGQAIRGTWGLYTWTCSPHIEPIPGSIGVTTEDRWIGISDDSHPYWSLGLGFEGHDLFVPVHAGSFVGLPDSATQVDFYNLAKGATRTLVLTVKDEHGNLVPAPGPVHIAGTDPVLDSGSVRMLLVPDTSADVVFDNATAADATVFMWKVDTFTVSITGKIIQSVPLAPFSPMTATGAIIFTDETTTSPLPSQTFPYSISIPVAGALGPIGAAATGPQTIQWPWFDHTPFGGINGPTSRTVRYDLTGTITDTFGNQYPVTAAARTYLIEVSFTKISYQGASIGAYASAAVFGVVAIALAALSALVGAAAAVPGAAPFLAPLSVLLGAGGGVSTAMCAYFTALAAGDQANAADPPALDPNYRERAEFSLDSLATLPKTEASENLRQFALACAVVTHIYPALTATEGRILGARAAKDAEGVVAQQQHLAALVQRLSRATDNLRIFMMPAIDDFHAMLDTDKRHPITTKQMSEALVRWSRKGIPDTVRFTLQKGGLKAEDIAVFRRRLENPKLRESVVNYASNLQSLASHLTSAGKGAEHEAQPFLEMKL